jgi:hypothetical protein
LQSGSEIACFRQILNVAQVLPQVLQLRLDGLPDQVFPRSLVSGQQQVVLPVFLAAGSGICLLSRCLIELINQLFTPFPVVVQNAGIRRKMNVSRRAGRVQDSVPSL